jgi:cephalosporin-C deacetylase
MFVDLALDQLREYRPSVLEPDDFDAFWAGQVAEVGRHALAARFTPVDSVLRHVQLFDVSFAGYGGNPVKGWLLLPHRRIDDETVIVEYIGYGGGRGHPVDRINWSSVGYPHFVMDSRGQNLAETPDPGDPGDPSAPGWLTRGVGDPRTYYFTRLFIDAARAVDAARHHPELHDHQVVTSGGSQGGGLALAAAHLGRDVRLTLPDVPFLSHLRRAAEITASAPYVELANYCKQHYAEIERVFATISYIDVVNHAKRIAVPGLFSVALQDDITPASTVFAAYNHYAGEKAIAVYPFNGHEGGGSTQFLRKLDFLQSHRAS